MLKKDILAKTNDIWCGLNKPEIGIQCADLTVFGIPYDSESVIRTGTAKAPSVLRDASKISAPFNENFESFKQLNIYDAGDFVADKVITNGVITDSASEKAAERDAQKKIAQKKSTDCTCDHIVAGCAENGVLSEEQLEEYFEDISAFVKKLVRNDKFFIMIGGDHTATIPVLTGIDHAMEEDFGIIYIGAHFDLHDTVDGQKYTPGTVARRAFKLENISGPDNICFIGTRTIDEEENQYRTDNNIKYLNSVLCHRIESDRIGTIAAKQLKQFKKVYITLDIDALDPAYAAGVCYPQFAGLYGRQLLNIISELFKSLNVIGMDIVGMAPDLDPSLASTFAARKIFQEVCGHCAKKLGKLSE